MFQFFETIKIEKSSAKNLSYHQKRLNKTFDKFYPEAIPFSLEALVNRYNFFNDLIYKFRVTYSNCLENAVTTIYVPKVHKKFKFIELYENPYNFKFEDRNYLTQYKNSEDEEIIFILNGQITDTTYSNLAFKKEDSWFVPKTYLLNGTQRQFLIDTKKVIETEINLDNIHQFTHFKLINAMLEFENSTEYSTQLLKLVIID